jgi:hypothetical protein
VKRQVRRCDKCEFWESLDNQRDSHEDDQQGRCRRYPPKLDLSQSKNWMDDENHVYDDYRFWNQPITESCEWCGEYRAA